ncbi:hypothetical protein LFV75_RS13250 [Escherichia coli]
MKWIKALNLQQWADSIPAKVIFPALIADLIRATANSITEIRFPNGDKGQVRGYDGVLKAEGVAPYVILPSNSGQTIDYLLVCEINFRCWQKLPLALSLMPLSNCLRAMGK